MLTLRKWFCRQHYRLSFLEVNHQPAFNTSIAADSKLKKLKLLACNLEICELKSWNLESFKILNWVNKSLNTSKRPLIYPMSCPSWQSSIRPSFQTILCWLQRFAQNCCLNRVYALSKHDQRALFFGLKRSRYLLTFCSMH